MLKILHVYRTFFPDTQGGLEETVRQIAKSSLGLGLSVRIITVSKKISEEKWITYDGIEVIQLPELLEVASCNIPSSGISTFRSLSKRADIIHFHFPWPYADFLRLLAPRKKPIVITYHSDIIRQRWLSGIYSPFMHRFLKSAGQIVATSPNYLKSSPVLAKYAYKTSVIPIGMDPSGAAEVTADKQESLRRKYGEGFFFFIGVLRYYKGLDVLLDAAKGAGFKVIIAGSGPEEKELKAKASRLGLDNVYFLGRVDDKTKAALLDLCLAVVFPSCFRSEAFGVTLLEGAISGKPLISTEIGTGTSWVNRHMETGLVVKAGDSRSLRSAMNLLHRDKDLARTYGKNARERFDNTFTAQNMCSQYLTLYQSLLGTNGYDQREEKAIEEKAIRPIRELYSPEDRGGRQLTISTVLYKTGIHYVENHVEALLTSAEVLYEEKGVQTHLYLIDNSNDQEYSREVKYIVNAIKGLDYLDITLYESRSNIGYGRANNLALPWMHSKYHLITNPDVIVSPEALTSAVSYMEKTPECGLLTPYVETEAEGVIHVAKSYPDCFTLFLRYLGSARLSRHFSHKLDSYARKDLNEEEKTVELAGGCFLFARSDLLNELEGFDPRYFMYFEDFDLCLRINKRAEIHWVPNVKILHYGGDVGRKGFRHHFNFAVSAFKFFSKHGWKLV